MERGSGQLRLKRFRAEIPQLGKFQKRGSLMKEEGRFVKRLSELKAAIVLFGALAPLVSLGAIRPDKVHTADTKKTGFYLKDGLVVGGDRAIGDVVIKDIRRASNTGFERLVIDLEGTLKGEPAAIPRPPFFQVAVSPEEERMVLTVWGKPRLGFDSKKASVALKKSPNFSRVEFLPRMEDESWTFSLGLKPGRSVEVFELTNPVRIIVDIRGGK